MIKNKDVNDVINKMYKQEPIAKGSYGEDAVFKICEQLYQTEGGILIHSFEYKTDKDLAGNVKKKDDGNLYIENTGSMTEIDVMYISKFRVFPIEVKAYKAPKITITDKEIKGCKSTSKNPVHQNEMHCRHLYPAIFRALPNGDTRYIVPIVCMVDRATIVDERSPWQKDYVKLSILDTIQDTIVQNNYPLECQLNLQLMNDILKEIQFGSKKYLPPRL